MFLTQKDSIINEFCTKNKGRVVRKWLNHTKVQSYLNIGDYGVLIRDESITNKVASPVKFAEYLSAGVKVLISENLWDFSDFVQKNEIGEIIKEDNFTRLKFFKTSEAEKQRIKKIAEQYFSKESLVISNRYKKVAEFMP